MMITHARRPILASMMSVPIAILLAVLAWQLVSYGPTSDPDPDGYVSYAQGLLETGRLQSHRRLPGYPALIAVVDTIAPGSTNLDMFWFHSGLILSFALISTLLVWKYIGYPTALIYLALIAINSYFARAMVVMLADLPSALLLYSVIAAGLGFIITSGPGRWIFLVAAGLAMVLNFAVHSASALLLQVLIWTTIGMLLVRVVVLGERLRQGPFSFQPTRSTIASLIVLSVVVYGTEVSVKRLLQLPHNQIFIEHPVPSPDKRDAVTNSETFYRSWLAYRLLLCLPPPSVPGSFDMAIEEAKSAISKRVGYPTDAVVPPAFAPEFLALIQKSDVPLELSYRRLTEHPVTFVGCALSEMRAKWYFIVRNLTPFTPFETDKTWITPVYPPASGGASEKVFWSTGLYLSDALGSDRPLTAILPQLLLEVARLIVVLALTIGGLFLLDRRLPLVGMVVGISIVGWFALLSSAVPVETRYLLPFFPILYMCQAWMISNIANRLFYVISKR